MSRLTNNKLKTICDGYFVNLASKEEAVKYRMLVEDAPKYEELYRKLADYEDIGTVEEFKVLKSKKEHNYDNCHNLTCKNKSRELGYNQGYNKAIDEFAKALLKCGLGNYDYLPRTEIRRIAEQMKAGGVE